MLLFPNALCCSLYERNCVCAVTNIFTKCLPANNFCQLLRVTRKLSCTSVGNAQAQLHFQDDQQRAFGISNISNLFMPINHRCLEVGNLWRDLKYWQLEGEDPHGQRAWSSATHPKSGQLHRLEVWTDKQGSRTCVWIAVVLIQRSKVTIFLRCLLEKFDRCFGVVSTVVLGSLHKS